MKLEQWQQKVLDYEGSLVLRCGRQSGKSTITSKKAHKFAKERENLVILCISASQRQSSYIFEKTSALFDAEDDKAIEDAIMTFKEAKGRNPTFREMKKIRDENSIFKIPPTQTKIILKNGSRIYSLPAGRTGALIRGLTVDILIADEAAYIPEAVWNAVLPMLAVSRKKRGMGWIILLSTPFGKGGYFYNCCFDDDFMHVKITSEQCWWVDKKFLLKERDRMTKAEYAQEYLAEFMDEWNQFFPTQLIKDCMTIMEWNTEKDYDKEKRYYLGVDIARYGGSENAFVIAEMDRKDNIRIVKALATKRVSTTETTGRIKALDEKFNFVKIFIDAEGVGGGVADTLKQDIGFRKIVEMNNSRRSLDRLGDRKVRVLKEDMYSNALVLMEQHKIEMINNLSLLKSLKSIVYEYTSEGRVKLFGNYSHYTEAFVRVCWCIKEKGLRVYIA